MIARLWHGKTLAAKADAYLDFLKRRAIPDYESVEGNHSAYVLQRFDGDEVHFLTLFLEIGGRSQTICWS